MSKAWIARAVRWAFHRCIGVRHQAVAIARRWVHSSMKLQAASSQILTCFRFCCFCCCALRRPEKSGMLTLKSCELHESRHRHRTAAC